MRSGSGQVTHLPLFIMLRRLFPIFLILSALGACTPGREQSPWWREAVFYEIFVRSFYDSNGDGIGDFNGITQKLDYLNDGDPATHEDLGVSALWLMPIHPSPSYHGYDVINYYTVNPDYGTLEDFQRLLAEAHERDMHVIIDLVLNHTSDQHPFFRDALRGQESNYHDWYLWSQSAGADWHPASGENYYFGLFCGCMPDLNYRNPEVTTEMQNVMRFWLEQVGVDGFRVDAARHLIEEGERTENTPATHDWYRQNFFPVYKEIDSQAYAVGEVFGAGASMVRAYSDDQLDQVFNFEMASGFVNSAAGGAASGLTSAIRFAQSDIPDFDFATFLTNHDQNRVMSVLNGNVEEARVAASLLLTSPGTPFLYYGEEIGMQGQKPDEDIRLPMQWSEEPGAGFTTAQAWRNPAADFVQINVAAQEADPDSLLAHYRDLIALRSAHPALRSDDLWLVETGSPALYAAIRVQDGDMILVLVNLSEETVSDYGLQLSGSGLPRGEYKGLPLMGEVDLPALSVQAEGALRADSLPAIPPHATWILQLQRR